MCFGVFEAIYHILHIPVYIYKHMTPAVLCEQVTVGRAKKLKPQLNGHSTRMYSTSQLLQSYH